MRNAFMFALIVLLAAGCASAPEAAAPTPTPTLIPAPTAEGGASATLLETVLSEGQLPWMTLPLVNARTGATFTLADFAGKTVYIEPMATWCTNCRMQQNIVRGVRESLGEADFVYLSLSVETNLTAADLAAYAERENYGWTFAVMTPEMLSALVSHFGMTVSNPPSTPHFLIRPDGAVTPLSTGIEQADGLTANLTAARDA